MKKLVIACMAILALSAGVVTYMHAAPDYEQCVSFRNVKATLMRAGGGQAYVYFESSNDGATNVSWCVNGTKDDYPMSIMSGETIVPGNGSARTETFSVKGCDRVWVKIFNCNQASMY